MPHPRSQWRTVLVALVGMAALLAGFALTGVWPVLASVYPAFVGGVGVCVGSVAAKAYGEHKARASVTAEPAP